MRRKRPKRHTLRSQQNDTLTRITEGLEESLECAKLQTQILEKKASARSRARTEAMERASGQRPIRVLVADVDDGVFVMANNELGLINGTTFEVSKATSYEQVFSAIGEKRFDVILIDCESFIGENTEKLVRAAKKTKKHAPVIVYGPDGSYECDMMAMKAGAADFLTKEELTAKRLEKSIRYCLCKCAG